MKSSILLTSHDTENLLNALYASLFIGSTKDQRTTMPLRCYFLQVLCKKKVEEDPLLSILSLSRLRS